MALPFVPAPRRARRALALLHSSAVAAVAAVAACAHGSEPAAAIVDPAVTAVIVGEDRLGDTVRVVHGQQAVLDGQRLVVGFTDLLDDSRCPANAMCVWQGNAAVRLRLAVQGERATPVLHTAQEPRTATIGSYSVELVNVEPYPGTVPDNVRIAPSVIVRVTRR
ncbi:MAG: hypothetical protein ACXW0Z_13855 [Gemmatirosa sp.]